MFEDSNDDNNTKISLKMAQISIQKFNNAGIPNYIGLLKNHKSNIRKSLALGDWDKIKKEEINATRVVKQLKNLLMEMDTLRSKLRPEDINEFDRLIKQSKTDAMTEMKAFIEMNLKATKISSTKSSKQNSYEDDDANNGLEPALEITVPQLQTNFQLSEHQLREREACLAEFENLNREITDLHSMFYELHQQVAEQAEDIEIIAENVEVAQVQVVHAEQSLRQALKYKKAMYPLCGALLGTCVGGPVGFLAGLKVGGLAAVGCGILGYTGGAVIKNKEKQDLVNTERKTD